MTTIPPVGTPMGILTLIDVYVWYDGPRLFALHNEAGSYFVGLFVEDDADSETFAYAPASPLQFAAIRSGALPLREAFQYPTDGGLHVVKTSLSTGEEAITWRLSAEIPSGWLPGPAARLSLSLSEPTMPGPIEGISPGAMSISQALSRGSGDVLKDTPWAWDEDRLILAIREFGNGAPSRG